LPEPCHLQHALVRKYIEYIQAKLDNYELHTPAEDASSLISWNAMEEKLHFHLESILYLPQLKDCDKIYFKIAVCHGVEQVSEEIHTEKFDLEKRSRDSSVLLNKLVSTDIKIRNLHRCAKLCICLHSVSRKKRESFSVCWLSLNLFDYTGSLLSGKKRCHMWQTTQNSFLSLCQADVSGSNPEKDCSLLNIEFMPNNSLGKKVSVHAKVLKNRNGHL
jgi:hypothetical protein